MGKLFFTPKFISRVEEFIRDKPEVARTPEEFIVRAGRLGLYKVKKLIQDCDPVFNVDEGGRDKEYVVVNVPDADIERVREFLQKTGIFKTVVNFYYFSCLMVFLGIWDLSPRDI